MKRLGSMVIPGMVVLVLFALGKLFLVAVAVLAVGLIAGAAVWVTGDGERPDAAGKSVRWLGSRRSMVGSIGEMPFVIRAIIYGGLAVISAVGIVMIFEGFRWLHTGQDNALLMIHFGLMIGALLPALAWWDLSQRRQMSERAQLRAQAPAEPWKWRRSWAQGRVMSQNRSWLLFSVAVAVFWNWPMPVAVRTIWDVLAQEGMNVAGLTVCLLYLTYMALGLSVAVWAFRVWVRWQKFGESCFVMDKVPAQPGQTLQGTIEIPASLPGGVIILKLACIFTSYRFPGKKGVITATQRQERIEWEASKTVERGAIRETAVGCSIPVRFDIPSNSPETTVLEVDYEFSDAADQPKNRWFLEMTQETPGYEVGYWAEFQVPVFKSFQSNSQG